LFPEGLFPSIDGLHLEALHIDPQSITAVLAVATPNAICPLCREPATRVHSRYVRTATDLPWAGIRVRLQITVRRFFCDTATCSRRIFAERLGEALPAFARRTNRLAKALCAIAFVAGGEGGARLAHTQAMPARVCRRRRYLLHWSARLEGGLAEIIVSSSK
jgi:transposase